MTLYLTSYKFSYGFIILINYMLKKVLLIVTIDKIGQDEVYIF